MMFFCFQTEDCIRDFCLSRGLGMVYKRQYGNEESYEPQLEPSDVEGIYFNEFREYVNAEGRVLTPAEIDEIRYKDDYREDIEQDFPHHR